MTDEFNTFLEYATSVKNAIKNVTHDDNMAKDEKVQVLYGTTSMAFAKYKEKILNGEKNGPLITFYLSGCEIDKSAQMGGYKLLNRYFDKETYDLRAPVIVNLKYTVTINCIRESQADLLQSQLMLAMPFNRPYWSTLNGQFVTMVAEEPSNLSSVDVGNEKDKINRRQLIITIERAYIEYPINIKEAKFIEQIGVWLNSEEIK